MNRLFGKACAKRDVGAASLSIAFQRIAGYRCAKKQQIVKMRHLAFGAATANVIYAGGCGASYFGIHKITEGGRLDPGRAG